MRSVLVTMLLSAIVVSLAAHLVIASWYPHIIAEYYPGHIVQLYAENSGNTEGNSTVRLEPVEGRPGILRVILNRSAVDRLGIKTVQVTEQKSHKTETLTGSILAGNAFDQLVYGVHSIGSQAGRIRDNVLTSVAFGVVLDHSNENFVLRNTATASEIALLSMMSHWNEVSTNVLTGGLWGIELYDSHLNRYTDNKVIFAQIDGNDAARPRTRELA